MTPIQIVLDSPLTLPDVDTITRALSGLRGGEGRRVAQLACQGYNVPNIIKEIQRGR